MSMLFVIGLLLYWPSWLGCQALQAAGGPIRIVRGRRTSASSRVPSGSRARGKSSNRRGGGSSSTSSTSSNGVGNGSGRRKATHKIKRNYSRGSMSVMARMRRKVGSCTAVNTDGIFTTIGSMYV